MNNLNELDGNQRRVFIDCLQAYNGLIDAIKVSRQYRGGMRWKKTGDREYLFKTRDSRGNGKSMGVRSLETELIYNQFKQGKLDNLNRSDELKKSLSRLSKLAIAEGINRMPKLPAQIVRLLNQEGVMGNGLSVIGTHSIYAYEAAAGVMVGSNIVATQDIDLMYRANNSLKLSSANVKNEGLIGLLQKVDKSFRVAKKGHFMAQNNKGFMVELIKPTPTPTQKIESQAISSCEEDLIAAELPGLRWLESAPSFKQVVIASDGIPVELIVPDPRYFALNKLWVSQQADRDPVKKPRDNA